MLAPTGCSEGHTQGGVRSAQPSPASDNLHASPAHLLACCSWLCRLKPPWSDCSACMLPPRPGKPPTPTPPPGCPCPPWYWAAYRLSSPPPPFVFSIPARARASLATPCCPVCFPAGARRGAGGLRLEAPRPARCCRAANPARVGLRPRRRAAAPTLPGPRVGTFPRLAPPRGRCPLPARAIRRSRKQAPPGKAPIKVARGHGGQAHLIRCCDVGTRTRATRLVCVEDDSRSTEVKGDQQN